MYFYFLKIIWYNFISQVIKTEIGGHCDHLLVFWKKWPQWQGAGLSPGELVDLSLVELHPILVHARTHHVSKLLLLNEAISCNMDKRFVNKMVLDTPFKTSIDQKWDHQKIKAAPY